MAKHFDRYIEIEDRKIPLRIYVEFRRNVRAALGKDHVILRMPVSAAHDLDKHLVFTKNWLLTVNMDQPHLLSKFHVDDVPYEYTIKILGSYEYKVVIEYNTVSQGSASLKNSVIKLTVPDKLDDFAKRKMIRDLTSKILVKVFKKYVESRVHHFNEKYFNKEVKGVTLRYNTSNWGSCSTKGRINLSTRGLLLPIAEFDYIIVHELSHLVEMNHSDRFWKVVKSVIPDYEDREAYIAKHGSKLDF